MNVKLNLGLPTDNIFGYDDETGHVVDLSLLRTSILVFFSINSKSFLSEELCIVSKHHLCMRLCRRGRAEPGGVTFDVKLV